ncbi:hypothetical protein JQ596_27020 [Bradyrhizobium manausense]|uniref:hypothetical protein n=1 Tax=Bradyrhizobium TaxID=374 RepID=UPI001BAB70F0|nr:MULTISPECIES: hypothetical protein [Bradyrhizobium]MBR0829194.1 hypothetical protein [Bradyrhizobium manausense]UVO29873.1 hypothetical protein KUF59_03660 [Bradyrhizobium arachidis]
MRKLILIAVISVLATQAYAGQPRSLSLATANASEPAAEQPKAQPATVPQAAPATTTTTATPATTVATQAPATTATAAPATTPVATTTTGPAKTTTKPKRQPSVEARVIRELHRHGIYW